MPTDPDLPKGLHFFHPDTPPAYRRNRWVFAGLMALIGFATTWPIYPYLSGIYPIIGGFPLSFSWIILCLLLSLLALVALYQSDKSLDVYNEE